MYVFLSNKNFDNVFGLCFAFSDSEDVSSLQHNIPCSFCIVLILWNLFKAESFLFVTSSFLFEQL